MQRQRDAGEVVHAVLRDPQGRYLLVRPRPEPDEPWQFPGTRVPPTATPEEALRRACRDSLRLELGTLVPQPPFTWHHAGRPTTIRYYAGQVSADEVLPVGVAELRWVTPSQMAALSLDPLCVHVARCL